MTNPLPRFHAWLAARRTRLHIAALDRLLRGASLNRYSDDSLAWLELHGHRFYFDGSEDLKLITTYQPEERQRRLIITHRKP